MSVRAILIPCCAVALALALAGSTPAEARHARTADGGAAPAPPSLPACILVVTESRYVPFGYNHIVTLKNGCSKAAMCSVSTDVNPQATTSEIASGQTVEVLTFSASPAQTFKARVTCSLAR